MPGGKEGARSLAQKDGIDGDRIHYPGVSTTRRCSVNSFRLFGNQFIFAWSLATTVRPYVGDVCILSKLLCFGRPVN